MSKGITTKETILKSAFELSSKFGFESLSIGELAKSVGMSKSGLFSHFKSKETLQIMVMDYAANRFTRKVIAPALKKERGLPRIRAMMDNWKAWSTKNLPGGCPIFKGAVEFDDRPGKVRDRIQHWVATMIGSFEKAIAIAKEEGHLNPDVDEEQLAYELYANMVTFHIYKRLLNNKPAEAMFENTFQAIMDKAKS